jgi:hypothetical protein
MFIRRGGEQDIPLVRIHTEGRRVHSRRPIQVNRPGFPGPKEAAEGLRRIEPGPAEVDSPRRVLERF